jgi:organic hydroperoxide reductase OsmC/OhrA
MFKFPMNFTANAISNSDTTQTWKVSCNENVSHCAIPVEFGGPGGGFSPEDLYAQALTNCFVATFKVYAQASKLEFESINVKSDLTVDLNEQGKPVMKDFVLNVEITGAKNPQRIQTLAEKAFSSGFILNSVKTNLQLNLDIKPLAENLTL